MIIFEHEELVKLYEDLIKNPENILGNEQEFQAFLQIPATREDLLAFKQACVRNELYEWAADILKKINSL